MTTREVLAALEAMGGRGTSRELIDRLPFLRPWSVRTSLTRLTRQGRVHWAGVGSGAGAPVIYEVVP